jgi:hypothetical protein
MGVGIPNHRAHLFLTGLADVALPRAGGGGATASAIVSS